MQLELLLALISVDTQAVKLTCNLLNLLQSELLQFDTFGHEHLHVQLLVVSSCRLLSSRFDRCLIDDFGHLNCFYLFDVSHVTSLIGGFLALLCIGAINFIRVGWLVLRSFRAVNIVLLFVFLCIVSLVRL